jgi:phosphatidylglycerophosphate synthase
MLANQILIFQDGKWTEGGAPPGNTTGFAQVRGYYANRIGYVRVVMCVLAAFTAATHFWYSTAALLLGSTLLDWVDGPVARRMNQCSIFGSGVDWLADIMAQLVAMAWLVSVHPTVLPWIAIATGIELCNCIFDFATTATGRYPRMPLSLGSQRAFLIILDWSMPGGSYTAFGNALWLAYPICILAFCLGLNTAGWCLIGPALLYLWCELSWTVFIIGNWTEPARQTPAYDDGQAGFRHCGMVPEPSREMLLCTSRSVFARMAVECAVNKAEGKIFWINIWQRSGGGEKMPLDGAGELDQWARDLVARHYASEDVELDGYGLIVNPVGSRAQEWHVDYTRDYSTIFIPMSELTPENALQYAVLPAPPREIRDLNRVDLRELLQATAWISVRQLLAPEWSLLRMDFGAIHRGIPNTGSFDRNMFWISVKKCGELLPAEPVLQTIVAEVVS